MKNKKIIAILGNICSGKSFAIDIFKKNGFKIFSADDLVKFEYLDMNKDKKSTFRKEIINLFRNKNINILNDDEIDKNKIINSVMYDDNLYLKMNEITKNFIVPKIYNIVENFKNKKIKNNNKNLAIFEIPLFFEMDLDINYFDKILIIDVNKAILKKRFLNYRNSSEKIFDFFINKQINFDTIKGNKNIIKIHNNLSKGIFLKKIKNFILKLRIFQKNENKKNF